MKIFKKVEKTEEEKALAEEKKAKAKKVLVTVGKVVGGVAAFAVGGLVVLACVGMSNDGTSEEFSEENPDSVSEPTEDATEATEE